MVIGRAYWNASPQWTAADVHTELITKEAFQKIYRDHREKIARMAWATEDAKRYLSAPDGEYLEVEVPTFPSRVSASR